MVWFVRLCAIFNTYRMFSLAYFGVVLVLVVVVVVTKSTPSPETEVWTLNWSLTKTLNNSI